MAEKKEVAAIDVCRFGSRCLCHALLPKQRRQRQVLHRLLEGDGDKQVALAFGISRETVGDSVKRLYRRFKVCSRTELTALAMKAKAAAPGPNRIRHELGLSEAQRSELLGVIAATAGPCGTQTESGRSIHAQILLKCDGRNDDCQIAEAAGVSTRTVQRIRRCFIEDGIAAAVDRKSQPPRPKIRRLDAAAARHLQMLIDSPPPEGHTRWTPALLAYWLGRLGYAQEVSKDTVWRTLARYPQRLRSSFVAS